MASLQEIHELIHSLNTAEKRHVKLYMNGVSGKSRERYIHDFGCFEKVKTFDKDAIKARLLKNKTGGNLSKSNTNLYNFICNVLVEMRQNTQKKIAFLKEMQTVELLMEKGLIDQAKKANEQALEHCQESGFDSVKLYLLQMRDKIDFHVARKKNNYDIQQQRLSEQLSLLDQLKVKVEILQVKREFYHLVDCVGTPRTQEELDRYAKLLEYPVFKKDVSEIPQSSVNEFFDVRVSLYTITFNIPKASETNKKGIEAIQNIYDVAINPAPEFFRTLRSLEYATLAGEYEEMLYWIDAFKRFRDLVQEKGKLAIITAKLNWVWLYYYIRINDIEKAAQYLKENEHTILDTTIDKLNAHNYIIYLLCARILFLNEEYNASLDYINRLLDQKGNIRPSLIPPINCLRLLIHHRLGNHHYLPHAVRSVYRSLKSGGRLFEPEKAIIEFFRRSANLADVRPEIKKLYNKLKELEKDKFNKAFFGMADYLKWLEVELQEHNVKQEAVSKKVTT